MFFLFQFVYNVLFSLFEQVRAGTRRKVGNPRDSPGVDTGEFKILRERGQHSALEKQMKSISFGNLHCNHTVAL